MRSMPTGGRRCVSQCRLCSKEDAVRMIGIAAHAATKHKPAIALVLLSVLAASSLPACLVSARAATIAGGGNPNFTNLMFPYGTSGTSLVITNGTMNVLGTTPRSGTCPVYFVATSIGGQGPQTAKLTTSVIAAGTQLVLTQAQLVSPDFRNTSPSLASSPSLMALQSSPPGTPSSEPPWPFRCSSPQASLPAHPKIRRRWNHLSETGEPELPH